MLKSMTGYGRSVLEIAGVTQAWEVRSVNNRHLDIKWRLPAMARPFEAVLEKVVRHHAKRGRLDILLRLHLDQGVGSVQFDTALASAMLNVMADFARDRDDVFVPDYNRLFNMSFLWEGDPDEPDADLLDQLETGLDAALRDWDVARRQEAQALQTDIETRLLQIGEWVRGIAERAPDIKEERYAQVRERLAQMLTRYGSELDEGRFLQEVVILADKLDVSEELTRLAAHLERMHELLAEGREVGKRLDFTLQEAFREITTCGNKVQDMQVSRIVVDCKGELEKCREQVQNIE